MSTADTWTQESETSTAIVPHLMGWQDSGESPWVRKLEMKLVSYNPADGSPVGALDVTPASSLPKVIDVAREAGVQWSAIGISGRQTILTRAAEEILSRADAIAHQLTAEMGKPLREALGEVKNCGGQHFIAELKEMAVALESRTLEDARTRSTIHYDPFGVCAVITPWNFPFAMPHWMVLPALMAGNSVILKPSEETPLTAQAYADALNAVLPPGILQVVHGADAQGRALVQGGVDLVAFTGSREVGQEILSTVASDLTRVILELGGKDPLIVLDDADLGKAARFAARNSFRNAGQVCVSTERIYVESKHADAFVSALADEAKAMTMGPGFDAKTQVGPMINARQRAHVAGQIEDAVERGATLIVGGELSEVGHFMSPAVLDGVTHEMDIATHETFGPVACVIRVSDEAEAVRLANDSLFGLGAVVFGGDEAHAETVARKLNAGMVGINRGVGGVQGTPWVGARQSGYGFHKSVEGHRQFAQVRVVSRRL